MDSSSFHRFFNFSASFPRDPISICRPSRSFASSTSFFIRSSGWLFRKFSMSSSSSEISSASAALFTDLRSFFSRRSIQSDSCAASVLNSPYIEDACGKKINNTVIVWRTATYFIALIYSRYLKYVYR